MAKLNKTGIVAILLLVGVLSLAIYFTTTGGFTIAGTQCGDVVVTGVDGTALQSYDDFRNEFGSEFTDSQLIQAGLVVKNGTLVEEDSCPEVLGE